MPPQNEGWRLFFHCPERPSEFEKVKEQFMRILTICFSNVKARLIDTGYSQELDELHNIAELNKFFNHPALRMDPYIVNFNAAINELSLALYKSQIILDCSYMKWFLREQQNTQCSNTAIQRKFDITQGLILLSFSSFLSCIACIHWYIINYKRTKQLEALEEQNVGVDYLSDVS